MGIPERKCFESCLVFGDDRSHNRRPREEVIVHADADNIAIEARLGDGVDPGSERPCGVEIQQGAVAVSYAAEIVIEIFDLEAPIGKEHPFETAASRPAGARIAISAKRPIGIGHG